MSWLFEDPTALVVAGVAIEALLAVALVKTGQGRLLAAMVVVGLLIAAGVLTESLVVTEYERVESMLQELADSLESNDHDRVLDHLAPSAGRLRGRARRLLSLVTIQEAKITSEIEVRLNPLTNPPSARADFTARVEGDASGAMRQTAIRHISMELHQVDGRWLVADYDDSDFGGGGTGR